jgi:hypothetical protein
MCCFLGGNLSERRKFYPKRFRPKWIFVKSIPGPSPDAGFVARRSAWRKRGGRKRTSGESRCFGTAWPELKTCVGPNAVISVNGNGPGVNVMITILSDFLPILGEK